MSIRATPPTLGALPAIANAEASKPVDPKATKAAQLHKAAAEFESMLVRQLLTSAHMGGTGKQDAYAGMAVDALASGIEKGGGLGLTRQIEDAIARADTTAAPPGNDSSK